MPEAVAVAESFADELATEMLRAVPRGENGSPRTEPPKRGRPPVDMFDLLVAGFIMGLTGQSARAVAVAVGPPVVTSLCCRLSRDLLPVLRQAARLSSSMATSSTGSPEVVSIDWSGDEFNQAVRAVGIGRARRKNETGLLVDALLRVIGVNLKILASHGMSRDHARR